jgi:hypothetical protein
MIGTILRKNCETIMSIVCRGIPVNGTDVGMIPFANASRQFILSVTTYREQDK